MHVCVNKAFSQLCVHLFAKSLSLSSTLFFWPVVGGLTNQVYVCVSVYTSVYACGHVCGHVCVYVWVYVCACVWVCAPV